MLFIYIGLGIVVIWLAGITFLLLKTVGHYKNLSTRTGSQSIDSILDSLVTTVGEHKKDLNDTKEHITGIKSKITNHFQKLGFVRFNPFDHIGGEQSFVLALLDDTDSGIVINFLYTREGVRIYAKQVKSGIGIEYELSDEEKEAIKLAQ